MRTRAKLLLGTLGIVAATTGLALWQNQPLRLESVGQRIPALDSAQVLKITWLSSREIIAVGHWTPQAQRIDLASGVGHEVPVFSGVDPYSYNASPDGKWLLAEERIDKTKQLNLLLFHPDGTGLRRFPFPKGMSTLEHSYWLPDSSHWVSYGRLYSVDGNPTTNAALAKALPPTAIQSDGRWLYPFESNRLAFSLCNPNYASPCEQLAFSLPPGRSKAESHRSFLSRDSQSLVVELDPATAIPERETWEVLLKRELPVAYQELWKLSRTGKPRLLLREAVTKKWESTFSVESVSPDGTRALVQNAEGEYYLLKL